MQLSTRGEGHDRDARLYSTKGHNYRRVWKRSACKREGHNGQIAFGMDNAYKCEVEIWGNLKTLSTDRIYSPPATFEAVINLTGEVRESISVPPDDQFRNSAEYFIRCIEDIEEREKNHFAIRAQAALMTTLKKNPLIILE